MEKEKRYRETARSVPVGRVAAATLALAGLSASVFTVSSVGAATRHAAKSVVISTAKNAKLGTILVSSSKTLYTVKPSKIACNAQCLTIWPAVLLPKGVTKATAGTGVTASKLGTVKRAGGALQVTYASKALYWFSGDKAAGQVHGNLTDTWGTWSTYATKAPSSSSVGTGGTNTGTGGVAF